MTTETLSSIVTKRELAKYLRLSTRTIDRLIQDGQIPAPMRIGHSVRWRVETIEQWISEQHAEAK